MYSRIRVVGVWVEETVGLRLGTEVGFRLGVEVGIRVGKLVGSGLGESTIPATIGIGPWTGNPALFDVYGRNGAGVEAGEGFGVETAIAAKSAVGKFVLLVNVNLAVDGAGVGREDVGV